MTQSPETGSENYLRRSVLMFGATMLCVAGAFVISMEQDATDKVDVARLETDNFAESDFALDTVGFGETGHANEVIIPDDLVSTEPNNLTVPLLGIKINELNESAISETYGQYLTIDANSCETFDVDPSEESTGVQVFTDYSVERHVTVNNGTREEGEVEVCATGSNDVDVVVGLSEKSSDLSDVNEIEWQYPENLSTGVAYDSFAPIDGWGAYPETRDELNRQIADSNSEFVGAIEPIRGLQFNFFETNNHPYYGVGFQADGYDLRQLIMNTFNIIQASQDSPYRTAIIDYLNGLNGRFDETQNKIINVFVVSQEDQCFERNTTGVINTPIDDDIESIRCSDGIGFQRRYADSAESGVYSLWISSQSLIEADTIADFQDQDVFANMVSEDLQRVLAHEMGHLYLVLANGGEALDRQRHSIDQEHSYLTTGIGEAPDLLDNPRNPQPLRAIAA